jgi:hypothetical protein
MLARKHCMVCIFFFAVIVVFATGLAHIWFPYINDVTCLLTLPIASGDGLTIARKQKKLQNTLLPPPLSNSSSSPLLPA